MALRAHAVRPALLQTLTFTGISLLPVATFLLVDSSLFGSWRLYLASAGFAMFLAAALQGTKGRAQIGAGVVLIAFHVAALQHNLAIWGQVASIADRTCAEATQSARRPPASALPARLDGVPFLRNGFDACVAFHQARLNRLPALPAAR